LIEHALTMVCQGALTVASQVIKRCDLGLKSRALFAVRILGIHQNRSRAKQNYHKHHAGGGSLRVVRLSYHAESLEKIGHG
jgi:hypothetical protein